MSLSSQLRSRIRSEPTSVCSLAASAGVSRSVLSRFLAEKRTITLATADRLAGALGVDLTDRGIPDDRTISTEASQLE
jgi:transcriptional regulator with XRE-family HTH domain